MENVADSTCAPQTLEGGGESFGPGQEVILELGQTFALCQLHADLVLLLSEAGALTVQQELAGGKQVQSHVHMFGMFTCCGGSRIKFNVMQTCQHGCKVRSVSWCFGSSQIILLPRTEAHPAGSLAPIIC